MRDNWVAQLFLLILYVPASGYVAHTLMTLIRSIFSEPPPLPVDYTPPRFLRSGPRRKAAKVALLLLTFILIALGTAVVFLIALEARQVWAVGFVPAYTKVVVGFHVVVNACLWVFAVYYGYRSARCSGTKPAKHEQEMAMHPVFAVLSAYLESEQARSSDEVSRLSATPVEYDQSGDPVYQLKLPDDTVVFVQLTGEGAPKWFRLPLSSGPCIYWFVSPVAPPLDEEAMALLRRNQLTGEK